MEDSRSAVHSHRFRHEWYHKTTRQKSSDRRRTSKCRAVWYGLGMPRHYFRDKLTSRQKFTQIMKVERLFQAIQAPRKNPRDLTCQSAMQKDQAMVDLKEVSTLLGTVFEDGLYTENYLSITVLILSSSTATLPIVPRQSVELKCQHIWE